MQQQSTGADNRWGAGTMRSGLCIYCGVMVVVVVVVVVVVIVVVVVVVVNCWSSG